MEPVPSFYLYGEPPQAVVDNFLHVETLEARSRPAGWRIRPHAHRELNHLILIAKGGGTMEAETSRFAFEAPTLLLVPSRVVHGFTWHEGSTGAVITLANSHRDAVVRRDPDAALLFSSPRAVALVDGAARRIGEAARDLMRELGWTAPGHRAAVDAALMTIVADAVRGAGRQGEGEVSPLRGRQAALVAQFRALVEERYRRREPVERYAALLGVSATTLRVACAATAGMAPAELLNQRALLEAKRALCYTNATVAEIAYALGFADPAYFTRMFTRAIGKSPRRFREREARALA